MNFFVMDIETYEKNGKVVPYVFVLKTSNGCFSFYKGDGDIISNFLNEIEVQANAAKMKSVEVFTHNINFDGYLMIEYFLNKKIPFDWFIRNLNLYYIDLKYKGYGIKIRCSYKILGVSVKKLGEILNQAKKPFPYKFVEEDRLFYEGPVPDSGYFENDEDRFEFIKIWGNNVNIKKISIEYCVNDAEIVFISMKNLFNMSNVNLLKKSFSFSSYAYKLFAKKYDFCRVTKNIVNHSYKEYIENSYFGGRTEIFGNTLDGYIHRFDFPGMYGSCMLEKFPIGDPIVSSPKDFEKAGFYSVTVKSDLKIPILPVRGRNGSVIYPNGEFTTCLSKDEFVLFLEKGGIVKKIHSALTYDKEEYVFKDFVEEFEILKKAGGFYKLYGKQVINSLYGSFALRKDRLKYLILYDANELDFLMKENKLVSFVDFGGIIIAGVSVDGVEDRCRRNLAYSSFIASKARIKLHKNVYAVDDFYKKTYGEKYKLLYLETDSIDICLPEPKPNEKIMDVEWQKIYKEGVYISPKFYCLKEMEKPKIKGIRKSPYKFEQLKEYFYDNKIKSIKFEDQLQFSKKEFVLNQEYVSKVLNIDKYNKRIFSKDKLETSPIVIKESEK